MGVALAVVTAHGLNRLAAVRLGQAAAVSLVCVTPVLLLASATIGLASYIQTGLVIAGGQHMTTNTHAWPEWPIRRIGDVIRLDGPADFAPTVSLRWTETSSVAERSAVLSRYGLTPVASDGPLVQVVKLSDGSPAVVRALINEPIVADTAGIDRGRSAVPWSTWPIWERWRFSYWWLRFRLFAGVDEHTRAGEAVASLFYALPLIVVVAAAWLKRYLQPVATAPRLVAFAILGVITAFGLMRTPYDVRAVDDVVCRGVVAHGCRASWPSSWRPCNRVRHVRGARRQERRRRRTVCRSRWLADRRRALAGADGGRVERSKRSPARAAAVGVLGRHAYITRTSAGSLRG
jgi:hypothetical protein